MVFKPISEHLSGYILAICLAFLGSLLSVPAAVAHSGQCKLILDANVKLAEDHKKLFPDSKVFQDTEALPQGLFQNEHNFDKKHREEIVRLFPTENTYRFTSRDGHGYLILKVDNPLQDTARTITVKMKMPTSASPLKCEKMKYWTEWARGDEKYLTPLMEHITPGKKPSMSIGEAFITAEALTYKKIDQEYDIELMSKMYGRIFHSISKQIKDKMTAREKIQVVRENLKAWGLKNYCRDYISFKDFIDRQCTNCQGQTFLFTSLLLDLRIHDSEEWKLGFQLMKRHIRPVLYDGSKVIDIVYSTIEEDTGDFIFPLRYLAYLVLNNHRDLVANHVLDRLNIKKLSKPLNQSTMGWYWGEFLGNNNPPHDEVPGAALMDLSLYDATHIPRKTEFNSGPIPEKTTLDLEDRLDDSNLRERNTSESSGEGYADYDNRVILWENYGDHCKDEHINRDYITDAEYQDVKRIQNRLGITKTEAELYGNHCPGIGFTSTSTGEDYKTPRLLFVHKDPQFYGITLNETYKERVEKIRDYNVKKYVAEVNKLKEIYASPLDQVIPLLQDNNLESPDFTLHSNRQNAIDLQHFNLKSMLDQGIYDDIRMINAQTDMLNEYLKLQKRILQEPRVFLESFNTIDISKVPVQVFIPYYGSHSAHIFNALVQFFPKNKYNLDGSPILNANPTLERIKSGLANNGYNIEKHIVNPFTITMKKLLRTANFRVAVSPLKLEERESLKALSKHSEKIKGSDTANEAELPQFPMPISQVEFENYCESTNSTYYFAQGFAWQCPKAMTEAELEKMKPENMEELIINQFGMSQLIALFTYKLDLPTLTRLIAGMDQDYIMKSIFTGPTNMPMGIRGNFIEIIKGASHSLSASPLLLDRGCIKTQKKAADCIKNQNNFEAIQLGNTEPPPWIQTRLDLSFWYLAKLRLIEDINLAFPAFTTAEIKEFLPTALSFADNQFKHKVAGSGGYGYNGYNQQIKPKADSMIPAASCSFHTFKYGQGKDVVFAPCVRESDLTLFHSPYGGGFNNFEGQGMGGGFGGYPGAQFETIMIKADKPEEF